MNIESQNQATPIYAVRENSNDEFVILSQWLVPDGARVKTHDSFAVIETSKAAVELPSPGDGVLRYRLTPGSKIMIGDLIAFLCADESVSPVFQSESKLPEVRSDSEKFSAKARRLLKELGLSESDFDTYSDVKEKQVLEVAKRLEATRVTAPGDVVRKAPSATKMFEISSLENATANQISSQVVRTLDSAVLRTILSKKGEDYASVSVGELVTHAVGIVLLEFPEVNSYYEDRFIHEYKNINIGYAINIEKGLKVPVIKGVPAKTLLDVSYEVKDLAMKYLRDELTPIEVSGGTFTVTDLFSFGVVLFDPMINIRQGAVLGVCSPQLNSTHFNLVLRFDHRLSDGVRAALFLKSLEGVLNRL